MSLNRAILNQCHEKTSTDLQIPLPLLSESGKYKTVKDILLTCSGGKKIVKTFGITPFIRQRVAWQRDSTSPQNGFKESFSIALMCTTGHRIPTRASTNHKSEMLILL